MPSPGILDPSLIACDTYGHAILDKLDGLGVVASALGVDRVPIYKGVNVVGSSETIYTRDFIKGELCYLVNSATLIDVPETGKLVSRSESTLDPNSLRVFSHVSSRLVTRSNLTRVNKTSITFLETCEGFANGCYEIIEDEGFEGLGELERSVWRVEAAPGFLCEGSDRLLQRILAANPSNIADLLPATFWGVAKSGKIALTEYSSDMIPLPASATAAKTGSTTLIALPSSSSDSSSDASNSPRLSVGPSVSVAPSVASLNNTIAFQVPTNSPTPHGEKVDLQDVMTLKRTVTINQPSDEVSVSELKTVSSGGSSRDLRAPSSLATRPSGGDSQEWVSWRNAKSLLCQRDTETPYIYYLLRSEILSLQESSSSSSGPTTPQPGFEIINFDDVVPFPLRVSKKTAEIRPGRVPDKDGNVPRVDITLKQKQRQRASDLKAQHMTYMKDHPVLAERPKDICDFASSYFAPFKPSVALV